MQLRFLTLAHLLSGLFFSALEYVYKPEIQPVPIPGYKIVKKIKSQSGTDSNDIGIYKNKDSQLFFIKSLRFRFKNLFYEQLMNEASLLTVLETANTKNSNIHFSKVLDVVQTNTSLSVIVEIIEGEKLETKDDQTQLSVLQSCFSALKAITQNIKPSIFRSLPKRSNLLVFSSFPVYFLIGLLKSNNSLLDHCKSAWIFYTSFPYSRLFKTRYCLSHKDLSSENILVEGNKCIIIDPEVTTLAEEQTELATVARFYYQDISHSALMPFITAQLTSEIDKKSFTALSIYYTYQMMTIEESGTKYFVQAQNYIPYLFSEILPNINHTKTLAEFFYSLGLSCIAGLQKVTTLINKSSNSFILCYHSIGEDFWRFTNSPDDFGQQIKYLTSRFSIVSLSKLLSDNTTNQVSITFDDGYKNVYTNAFPILKRHNLTATIFILGNPQHANRKELDNNLECMTKKEVMELYNHGWEVGYHTNTHPNVTAVSPAELLQEIKTTKLELEKKWGIKLKYFAYPRGLYTDSIISTVKDAGYDAAFSVAGGAVDTSNMYLIPRVPMEGSVTLNQFIGLTSPLGLYFSKLFMQILVIKESLSTNSRNANAKKKLPL